MVSSFTAKAQRRGDGPTKLEGPELEDVGGHRSRTPGEFPVCRKVKPNANNPSPTKCQL
jgi:hypothetical protein